MRRLGSWLGMAALALQLAWPLLAAARPPAVVLVPLCTVEGETHYLEVPAGRTPLEKSSSHHAHCPLCYLGHAPALLAHAGSPLAPLAAARKRLHAPKPLIPGADVPGVWARGPPSSSSLTL